MNFFDNLFKNENKKYINGLTDELKSIYIYNRFLNSDKSILFVTNTLYEANLFYKSISNYTKEVLFFPMDDFLTSEALAISPELKNTRLETLNELTKKENKIVITNLMGYLRYLPPFKTYQNSKIILEKEDEFLIQELVTKLAILGYKRETIVSKTGEMAIRGFILDIFPIGKKNPIRFEFWENTIDSIRVFDIENQLTINEIDKIEIEPNTEFLCNQLIEDDSQKNLIKYSKVVNINDYMNNLDVYFNEYNELKSSYEMLLNEIIEYNRSLNLDLKTPYMNSLEDIINSHEYYLSKFDNLDSVDSTLNYYCNEIIDFPSDLNKISSQLENYIKNKKTIIICLSNQYQIQKVINNIKSNFIITNENEIFENKINLIIKNIENGFQLNSYVVISEMELFHKKDKKISYKSNFKIGNKIRNINKLNVGDFIVHQKHGIGKYLGIRTLEKNKLKKDYLMVEYKDRDKLYIPVEKIELITKYSSNDNVTPKLNKLGGIEWTKTKLRVQKKIENIAEELLNLYALRESSKGFSFIKDDKEQIEFEKKFTYEDTIDQRKVTEEIKRDMESSKPMDRLLCGDVGYGKTEVAFRAMFKAVMSGKQVAYLCPTTILSNQHYENAIIRFKDYPIEIACLNRFVSTKKVKEVLCDLKEGKIDIVIGTHRILSEDVIFKDLGLLVIDEEQRFGVKHKEKIKTLKNNIDVLTLSATPIPRTLQMSMTGIRNLSLIESPPVNRYPVQTYVLEENNHIIKEAIYKELSRDGQVFILYNHVDDLERKAKEISKLVPEANIIYAHGRMNKIELETVMYKFVNREYNVLLCTTIIETGIDIPSVNTLLIMDADHFGLSQLYQIRGRVGRGNVIAYCYLMYKRGKVISEIAEKRLNVIKEFTELGSGFSIAMRDLSIRGAGDILGNEQAGFIDTIGIELYLKMLNEQVNKLKGIKIEEKEESDLPLLDVKTSIDDHYVEETDLKIEIHKKINSIDSYPTLQEVKKEIEDRFGSIDEEMLIYMYEEWFEKLAKKFNITKVKQTNNFIEITLPIELINEINGEKLFLETSKISRMFRFKMFLKNLVVTLDIVHLDKHFIYYLIEFMEILEKSIKK